MKIACPQFRKAPLALALAAALAFPVSSYAAPGDPAGGEFWVNTTTLRNQVDSAISSDASGNFVIAWTSQDSSGGDFNIEEAQGSEACATTLA